MRNVEGTPTLRPIEKPDNSTPFTIEEIILLYISMTIRYRKGDNESLRLKL
jgi:hypothetical protein